MTTPAIVLCRSVTGLATVRALARRKVPTHAVVLDVAAPLRWSRHGHKWDLSAYSDDEERLLEALKTLAWRIGGRPVVIPTSDALALLIARHRDELLKVCRVWSTDAEILDRIIRKDRLYEDAERAGVPIIPTLAGGTLREVEQWSIRHEGPYFLKPYYEAIGSASVQTKNIRLPDRSALLQHVRERGLDNALVQRFIEGGDGEIFDTYGLCDANGRIVTMASHRRLRQYPPNTGTTSFGAIPSGLPDDEALFAPTRRLLSCWRFHGIFGIEWLRDRRNGSFHLVDFNARPFSSIGHLCDAGMNLPWLAWQELSGEAREDIEPLAKLPPSLWIDSLRDLASWHRAGRGSWWTWVRQFLQADHHAYLRATDPGPAARVALDAAGLALRVGRERCLRRTPRARPAVAAAAAAFGPNSGLHGD